MAEVHKGVKVGCLLLAIGGFFFVLGLSIPYWYTRTLNDSGYEVEEYAGLWKLCQERQSYRSQVEVCYSLVSSEHARGHIRAAQFFEMSAFLAALAAVGLLLLSIIIASCRDRRILPILSAICALGAAGCAILGCIIFGSDLAEKRTLSWAFAMAIIGGILFGIAGILILVFTVIKR